MRAIGETDEMEEERRLCYVAITRAKQTLTISHAKQRMLYGRTNAAMPSRFLRELPEDILVRKGSYYNGAAQTGYYNRPAQLSYGARPAVPKYTAASTQSKAVPLDLKKGDMVQHTAFGKGMVLSVIQMGGDALLEIAFDNIGTKKLMAKTASAHMKRV